MVGADGTPVVRKGSAATAARQRLSSAHCMPRLAQMPCPPCLCTGPDFSELTTHVALYTLLQWTACWRSATHSPTGQTSQLA